MYFFQNYSILYYHECCSYIASYLFLNTFFSSTTETYMFWKIIKNVVNRTNLKFLRSSSCRKSFKYYSISKLSMQKLRTEVLIHACIKSCVKTLRVMCCPNTSTAHIFYCICIKEFMSSLFPGTVIGCDGRSQGNHAAFSSLHYPPPFSL